MSGLGSKLVFSRCRNTPIHIVEVGYLSAIRIISGVRLFAEAIFVRACPMSTKFLSGEPNTPTR